MRARLLTASDLTWYALRVEPQREMAVHDALAERGHEVYCPIRTAWIRKGRSRNERVERSYALLPRYVLLGCLSAPSWYEILDVDHVIGAVGYDGEPYRIRPSQVQSMMDRESRGVWRAPVWHRSLRKGEAVDIGTRVRVQSPRDPETVSEAVFEVDRVEGANAWLLGLGILGADVVKVPLARLRRAS
jgi:transcription antitermination factor NusG